MVTNHPGDTKEKLAILPLDFSKPIRLLDFERPRVHDGAGEGPILFKRDATGISYPVRDGQTDNLWLQHPDGSPGKQLTDFKSEFIRDFDYSYDRKQLAIIRGPPGIRRGADSGFGQVADSLIKSGAALWSPSRLHGNYALHCN